MKTSDFRKKISSAQLKETVSKQFGMNVNMDKYSREQLEDIRNKLRTRIFQQEGQAGINDLLTNETYQKDKAMLALLNTRIKEMLGEDIKKLKDKLQQIEEAKKGVLAPKFKKHAKGSKGTDQTGDGKSDFDDVQVARMTAGGVPKKKAIAKATSDKFEENRVVKGRAYGGAAQKDDHEDHKETPSSKGSSEKSAADRAKDKAADRASDKAGKDWEARGYKRTVVKGKAQSGSPKDDDDLDESAEKCNHTPKGKSCPVHGLKECGSMKEAKGAKEPFAVGMAAAKKEAGIKKTPAKDLPKKVVKKGHEIGKSIKKAQKESLNSFRNNVSIVNESLGYLLQEDEEEKAKVITAASDMVNDITSWMQRVGQYQTKVMVEIGDEIRHNFGAAEAETFKQAVGPALSALLETLTAQREAISGAVAGLAGGQMPAEPMGAEPMAPMAEPEAPLEPAAPDEMNMPGDEFGASDAGASGREMRESRFSRRLAESHSIMSKLAK